MNLVSNASLLHLTFTGYFLSVSHCPLLCFFSTFGINSYFQLDNRVYIRYILFRKEIYQILHPIYVSYQKLLKFMLYLFLVCAKKNLIRQLQKYRLILMFFIYRRLFKALYLYCRYLL